MSNEHNPVPSPPPPPHYAAAAPAAGAAPSQGMAVTSMVLGIVGVFTFFFYGLIPILAIVFGGVSMSQSKKANAKASGMAIAGLVLGIIFTALFVLFLLIGIGIASNS